MNPRGGSVWPEWGVSITGIYTSHAQKMIQKIGLTIQGDNT